MVLRSIPRAWRTSGSALPRRVSISARRYRSLQTDGSSRCGRDLGRLEHPAQASFTSAVATTRGTSASSSAIFSARPRRCAHIGRNPDRKPSRFRLHQSAVLRSPHVARCAIGIFRRRRGDWRFGLHSRDLRAVLARDLRRAAQERVLRFATTRSVDSTRTCCAWGSAADRGYPATTHSFTRLWPVGMAPGRLWRHRYCGSYRCFDRAGGD